MNVISKNKMYIIEIDETERITLINTDDIVEAREEFLKKMEWMFNQAVLEKLKG